MRLNNYMKNYADLLLKSNRSFYSSGHNNLNNRRNLNIYAETSDFINNDIDFDRSKEFLSNRELLSRLKSINGKEIKPVKAVDNVLNFEKGVYNKMKTKSGVTAIFTAGDAGNVYMPYDDIKDNFSLSPSDSEEVARAGRLFTYLARDKTGYFAQSSFSQAEIKETLGSVGIKPGWFEVKSGNYSNKFYMFDDGIILGEYDVEAKRNGMNEHDWFGDGYTKDSKFILHGKEYKLDDEGHLNIPKGEGCLMRDLIRIK
ncbi:hypothetical protein NPD7_2184 [Clostridium sporogenes]|uniref:hypothetical protein n=1 Tax=Clostridium TaxID=1485 RepID=UPI0005F8A6FB|nr:MULTISPECIES: hypothetical protein [Clostridium]APF27610.1 hypothetical protein NPD7_2184 [Clostridium sporogenes]MDI6921765.1 hypothetical protein [Clostridium botulinum]WMU98590.1 hypothetical protein QA656_04785 [Clostridium botulinum]